MNARCRLAPILTLILLAFTGCGAKRNPAADPLPPPTAQTRVSHFVGSPLSGPTRQTVPAPPPAEAMSVHVAFVSLENVPSVGVPLGAEARLITATRQGAPVLPSSQLTGTARFVSLATAERFQTDVIAASRGRSAGFLDARAAVPRGVSAIFEATSKNPIALHVAGVETATRLQVFVYRPLASVPADMPQPVQIAVAVEDLTAIRPPADAMPIDAPATPEKSAPRGKPPAPKPVPPVPMIVQREVAIVEREVTGTQSIAITLPLNLGGGGKAVAVAIQIGPGDASTEHLTALSSAMEQIRQSAEFAASRPTTLPFGRNESAALRAASESLSATDRLRPTLVYLSGQTGARLCEDVALVADDSVLQKLAEQSKATIDGALNAGVGGGADPAAVGWLLDKASFQLLGKLLNEGKLPPELSAVLVNHAGEAGRNVASIEEVSRNLTSRQDLDNRLLAENLIYLEDSSPSARVRAFDWLTARGRAPVGFDPLASAKERRVALEKGMAAAAAGPATAPAK